MKRGFGAGFTFGGLATSTFAGLAALVAFVAFSFCGLASFCFFVEIGGASADLKTGVGSAAASGGSGGGASRIGASGATGAVYC